MKAFSLLKKTGLMLVLIKQSFIQYNNNDIFRYSPSKPISQSVKQSIIYAKRTKGSARD